MANYLTFASAEPFTIAVYNATKNWDGILEYSTDAAMWNEWDGTVSIASAEHSGEHRIYMRGSGNTVITGGDKMQLRWVLTGNDIRCTGNIENLLDYETVAKGEHPTMGSYCYCYMFCLCGSLTSVPALPAATLAEYCYKRMFMNCTSLSEIPALPATTLLTQCYQEMFSGCTNIKLSETQTDEYTTEYRIPTSGTGSFSGSNMTLSMFKDTGGTYMGNGVYMIPLNTTYYTANKVIPATQPVAPKLDPTALLMSWQVGNRIASMKK